MEYIQCPHCQKQYAVNEKLRAAIGKHIRCKHCNQAFEIELHLPDDIPTYSHKDPDIAAEAESIEAPSKTPNKEEQNKQKEQKKNITPTDTKKKVNLQLIITIVLATTLIISAVGAFLFFNYDDLFGTDDKKVVQDIMPQELIKPFEIKLPAKAPIKQKAHEEHLPAPVKKVEQPRIATLKTANMKPESAPIPVEKASLSQVCKDVSADYWIRTHKMATTNMDTKTYMKLLNENLEQANDIRKLCKDKSYVSNIAKAARTNQKPGWIEHDINARMDAANASQNGDAQ